MASCAAISSICTKANVPQELVTFLTAQSPAGLGMASLSDFANYFTEEGNRYESEIQARVLDRCEDGKYKEDMLVRSRLRTAWKLARSEFDKACARVISEDVQIDWDAPLTKEEETERATKFDEAYDSLSFQSEHTPMRSMVSRYVREFKSVERHVSLTDTCRIRSEAQLRPSPPKGPAAASGAGGAEVAPTARDHANIGDFMEAHRLMCVSWAQAGVQLVESKLHIDPDTRKAKMVRQCHLGESLHYHWFVECKTHQYGLTATGCLNWVMTKDLATRAAAKKLFKDGYPWGEAVIHALQGTCYLDWELATDARGVTRCVKAELDDRKGGQQRKPDTDTGSKRKADFDIGNKPKKYCEDFNSQKGCTKKEKYCPHKLVHKCFKCGNYSHGAHQCRKMSSVQCPHFRPASMECMCPQTQVVVLYENQVSTAPKQKWQNLHTQHIIMSTQHSPHTLHIHFF